MLAEREFINGPALLKMWTDFLQGSKRMKWMDIWLFVVLNYWMERNRLN